MPIDTGLVILALSAALALILIPLAIRLGYRLHLLDRPGEHKRHKRPTPYLGGAVLLVSMSLSLLLVPRLTGVGPVWDGTMTVVMVGAAVIFLTGFADDIRPLSAWVKLVIELGVGGLLYFGDVGIEILVWPGGEIDIGWLGLPLTMLWVALLTNAINLIDGLDGLAAGVSTIACAVMLIIGTVRPVGSEIALLWVLLGYLVVFWWFNRYPARIFLGDSGALQLGYYFAAFSLMVNFKSFAASALYLPLLALGVPVMETLSSFTRRVASGRNIMRADRRHLFHYLHLVGLSRRQVLAVFYSLSVVFGLFALAMLYYRRLLVLALLIVFMVVILALFLILLSGLRRPRR
jgi:UDP-GlcNAc:undecaprenyl-phosphate GlcNAc-1-phosphate transferase